MMMIVVVLSLSLSYGKKMVKSFLMTLFVEDMGRQCLNDKFSGVLNQQVTLLRVLA